MSQVPTHPAALRSLKTRLHGELISPTDEGYESARKSRNGRFDKHPALIIRCKETADVISAVQFARSQDLPVAVRAGGHDHSGNSVCDEGLVIDLSLMKGIEVDPQQRIARAQAGLTSKELLRATEPFGLALPTGNFSSVGLSGLTLGGGIGKLSSKYGLTIDNLLAVEIVMADGSLLTASATENPDLFWAVRGGGGNFGIVTTLTFGLHSIPQVLRGFLIHPMERASEAARFYREYTRQCPDEVTVDLTLSTGPGGQLVTIFDVCYCGADLAEGERVLAPLRAFGPPLVDTIHPMSVLEATTLLDILSPPGRCEYYRAEALNSLSDEIIDTVIAHGANPTSPFSITVFSHVHGAATRIDPGETAFALRREHYMLEMIAKWEQGEESQTHVDWAHRFWAAIEPLASEGLYINFVTGEDEARVRASYGPNYERLARLKTTYDPTNFFHLNQNIKPMRE